MRLLQQQAGLLGEIYLIVSIIGVILCFIGFMMAGVFEKKTTVAYVLCVVGLICFALPFVCLLFAIIITSIIW